jgi:hypothetical protein
MRTTVTLDDDVAASLARLQRERGLTFREAINSTLRAGLESRLPVRRYRLPTYRMGVRPGIDLDRALQLDAALEDEEILRKVDLRK